MYDFSTIFPRAIIQLEVFLSILLEIRPFEPVIFRRPKQHIPTGFNTNRFAASIVG